MVQYNKLYIRKSHFCKDIQHKLTEIWSTLPLSLLSSDKYYTVNINKNTDPLLQWIIDRNELIVKAKSIVEAKLLWYLTQFIISVIFRICQDDDTYLYKQMLKIGIQWHAIEFLETIDIDVEEVNFNKISNTVYDPEMSNNCKLIQRMLCAYDGIISRESLMLYYN